MDSTNKEKLCVTNKDELRRRHCGNYRPVSNGEIYLLPYEVLLHSKPQSFFASLSDYDHLKTADKVGKLSLKGLRKELWPLNDEKTHHDFWKNFSDSALKTHLNTILGTTKVVSRGKDWRKTYLKQGKEADADKPHHEDMLKCLYLLAHLHKASPTFIRQLALVNDAWSTDLRVFYPRKDFAFSEEYGGYLAELYTNILYHQPEAIRKVVKNLDLLIDKMVKYSDGMFAEMLDRRSEDIDSPGLKILKYNQIGAITHTQALQSLLVDKITGPFNNDSFTQLEERANQGLANANHYRLVAGQCLKFKLQTAMTKKGQYWYLDKHNSIPQKDVDQLINLYANALAADALNGLTFESVGSKSGKKDTSLPAAIRQMAEQNPQTIDEILESPALDCANIPEIYTKYAHYRTQYAECYSQGTHTSFIKNMKENQSIKRVLNYVRNNNLGQIHADIDEIERKIKVMNILQGNMDNIENVTIVFEYGMHKLPPRS
ncbi:MULTISPECIES: hypothetical protein [Enterobacteriaceae]|uniref:Uncharacterized protein n=1 Tax=Mangrovibacter plantisponsor TaxID=451513 RepID=A0A317Q8X8_9ENTR|nr:MULTISPECIES: hypothetical protein [Enterobacteriaceae]MDE9580349.1 hypothetical protein [Citrobacter koseri]PWW12849.1 hypothetical protein DES37_101426 [Mangrovibacter plantisponsor]